MTDRTVPHDEDARCDNCGATGAFDMYGDMLCDECVSDVLGEIEDANDDEELLDEGDD